MTISNDLMLSILAMDSYNRGYYPGVAGLSASAGTGIGLATILDSELPAGSVGVGFYALSYTWQGQTVIFYRGTDNVDPFIMGAGSSDLWRGWITGAGAFVPGGQAQLAVDFYNSAASGNVILTWHSLGGGLAGVNPATAH